MSNNIITSQCHGQWCCSRTVAQKLRMFVATAANENKTSNNKKHYSLTFPVIFGLAKSTRKRTVYTAARRRSEMSAGRRLISDCGQSMSCHVYWSTKPARPLKLTDHKDQSTHMDRSETIRVTLTLVQLHVKQRWRGLLYQSTTILRPS